MSGTTASYASKANPGQSCNTKTPSGPTYTPTPPTDTYKPNPPTEKPYTPTSPPDTYKPNPPTEKPYIPTSPPDTYKPNPPTEKPYTPTSPPDTYKPNPPTDTYKPNPPTDTYKPNPPHVHKDCSCGAEIPEDCSCKAAIKTVIIQGRIREDVKQCSYEFDLPCNHVCVMYGVRTAIYEQIVDITIRRRTERKAYKTWSFEGKKDAGLLNLEGSPDAYNLNIPQEDTDRVVVITFQSFINGDYKSSDMRYKEVVISTDTSKYCSYFYTFFVEAGDDCDFHDTDFCVSVLPTKK
ncbi:hypothetical protein M408DRAFT_332941 [Serendipita vermifera MAFF 305830]|uniref:Uncharacterized protein n=1 Tax=Serendipita vermifera MAFF 305830 TaxID=933852 RepID=A0A0C2W7E0_SERVB|nr:hypothetical protein M408DRAFT_332941 [Serendipita vermifera MAFF 305830]